MRYGQHDYFVSAKQQQYIDAREQRTAEVLDYLRKREELAARKKRILHS